MRSLMDSIMEANSSSLCQPDAGKSCGACCGLYNYVDSSRVALAGRLRARTQRFHNLVKVPADIGSYISATLSREDFAPRYEVIYCCEYLGFLDAEEKKIGCLLHPAQNSGIDFRTCSFYGQEICAGHICPSHHFIPAHQAQILIKIIDDWYLYGLCLTDIDLVTIYFRLLADKIGEEIKPDVFDNPSLKENAREFFNWKINWPFRSEETNRLGKYYFDGSQFMIAYIDYAQFGREISPLDRIFMSLSSLFNNAQEIAEAENLIEDNIRRFVASYGKYF
jgi:hypothetical protein